MKNADVISMDINSNAGIEDTLRKFNKMFRKNKGKLYLSDSKQGQMIPAENINYLNLISLD